MKKLFIAAMAVMLCVCFTLPAVAEVKTSGMVWVDAYIRDISKKLAAGGVAPGATTTQNGVTDLQINSPLDRTYVRFSYTNDKATMGALLSIYAGSINAYDNTSDLNSDAYMWWKPMSNFTLKLGKIAPPIGGLAPNLPLGDAEYYRNINDTGKGGTQKLTNQVPVGIAFGNLHGSTRMGLVGDYKINDMVSITVGIFDPDDDGNDNDRFSLLSTRGPGTTAMQEDVLPRIDITVPIRIGKFYIQPKAGWQKKSYDQVAAGQDDSFDCWVVGADASFSFGPVTILGEYAYGENLGASSFTGGLTTLGPAAYGGKIVDTEYNLWFGEIDWSITPRVTATGNYGQLDFEDPATSGANKLEIKRRFWSVNLRYALAPNFFIHPAFIRTDSGDTSFGGTKISDNGYTDYYGVSFYIIF